MASIQTHELLARDRTEVFANPVVFGGGNMETGLGEQSIANAQAAVDLWNIGQLVGDFTTAGNGPDTGLEFKDDESEAYRMAKAIHDGVDGDMPLIYAEPNSHDTLGSIWNIAEHVEAKGYVQLTFMAAEYHVDRAMHFGRKILGKKIDIVPIATCEVTSRPAIIKELATTALYDSLTLGVNSRAGIAKANNRYRKIVLMPKKAYIAYQQAQSAEENSGLRYSN